MFDRLSGLGATYVELRAMSCDSNTVRLRDGSMDAAVPAQDVGVTLRVLADGAWGVHSTTDLSSVYAQGEDTLRVARGVANATTAAAATPLPPGGRSSQRPSAGSGSRAAAALAALAEAPSLIDQPAPSAATGSSPRDASQELLALREMKLLTAAEWQQLAASLKNKKGQEISTS